MTYEVYRIIFIVALILSLLMLFVAVILFVVLRIPTVIGDLTGANARKAIENIRNQSKQSADKETDVDQGGHTDKISPSGRIVPQQRVRKEDESVRTSKLSNKELIGNETTVLSSGGNETTVLGGNTPSAGETMVLLGSTMPGVGETMVLDQNPTGISEPYQPIQNAYVEQYAAATDVFEIEFEITYIHTSEMIP